MLPELTETVQAYSCNAYSIDVPKAYETDAKTLDNFTTFKKGNMTIGIRLENNLSGDNVSTYTETQISEFAASTISALDSKAGSGISNTSHELTTFSSNAYPALHMTFEGGTEAYSKVYIEEYIITMRNYKYTIVFSCNSKSEIQTDEIQSIMDSFNANDNPITVRKKADNLSLIITFAALLFVVFIAAILVIRYFIKHNRKIK